MYSFRALLFSIFFGTLSALGGCASRPSQKIDNELLSYVKSFEDRYGVRYYGDAVIGELDQSKAGMCSISVNRTVITINKMYMKSLSHYGLEELMYHELGHCALRLNHSNNKDEYGCPTSIMYYAAFGNSWCYIDRREILLQELENMWKNSF